LGTRTEAQNALKTTKVCTTTSDNTNNDEEE